MQRAKVPTLCILSYNRADYLKDTLESLFNNTKEPFELIIHDDGSIDATIFPVLDYAERCGATVIRNMPNWNQGQGVALNRMFGMAKGDPILKLDADLEYSPGWLSKTLDILDSSTKIGLLGLCHYHHDPVDMKKTLIPVYEDNPCAETVRDWSGHTHILGSAFAVPRFIWMMYGQFEEYSDAYAEDFVFQETITKDTPYCCALPNEELVKNIGMGIGKSVVVQTDGQVHKIHKTPYIING